MKHRTLKTAAISAVLGLMPLAISAKESYLSADSTIVVRDYIANMEYVDGVLERVNFEGGYIDMTGDSPRYMYYVIDHLGNVRTVVDEDGNVCQVNHYYPYGDRFDDARDVSAEGSDNTRLFGGKEYSSDTGLHDFEARYADTRFGRFTTIDPLAEKYYSVSPYSYCAGDPVNRVDPSGMTDYYNYSGELMYRDLYDNGEIRLLEADVFEEIRSSINNSGGVSDLDNSFIEALMNASDTFTASIRSGVLSEDSAIAIINHYCDNAVESGDLQSENENGKRGAFGASFKGSIIADLDVISHDGRQLYKRGNDVVKETYLYDNSFNIKSSVDDHEVFHQNDPLMDNLREQRAYKNQINSSGFHRTTDYFQRTMKQRYDNYQRIYE